MSKLALLDEDFSSNAHTPQIDTHDRFEAQYEVPSRHSELCFEDGNIAVLCGHKYFLVHKSVLFRHSTVLEELGQSSISDAHAHVLEGRPVLRLSHTPEEVYVLLKCLYG